MLLSIVFLHFFFSSPQGQQMHRFTWLPGVWEMKGSEGKAHYESWSLTNDTLMSGVGFEVEGNDTTILESLVLTYMENTFWYIPTVPDQNNAKPIPFKLVQDEDNRFIFENKQHDFPQRIIYHYQPVHSGHTHAGDGLQVRVEALDGKGIDFRFLRK